MSRIIEQQRIDTAFAQPDELEQKRALDREIADMRTRIGILARKPLESLTDSERGEIMIARSFIERLDQISTNHRYRGHFISLSQDTRHILDNQLKEVRAVHAESQAERAELSSENIPEEGNSHRTDEAYTRHEETPADREQKELATNIVRSVPQTSDTDSQPPSFDAKSELFSNHPLAFLLKLLQQIFGGKFANVNGTITQVTTETQAIAQTNTRLQNEYQAARRGEITPGKINFELLLNDTPEGRKFLPYREAIVRWTERFDIDQGVFLNLLIKEGSHGNPKARPIRNGERLSTAVGLGQIVNGTWNDICRVHAPKRGQVIDEDADRFNPEKQILATCIYLDHLKTVNSCDDSAAVFLYHAGSLPTTTKAREYAPNNPAIIKVGVEQQTGRPYNAKNSEDRKLLASLTSTVTGSQYASWGGIYYTTPTDSYSRVARLQDTPRGGPETSVA